VRFKDSDFNNSSWARAKLASSMFDGVKLTGAVFTGISALGLEFFDTLLVGADMSGVSFRKQRLVRLDFSGADLSGCDFRDTVFEGAASAKRTSRMRSSRVPICATRSLERSEFVLLQASGARRSLMRRRLCWQTIWA